MSDVSLMSLAPCEAAIERLTADIDVAANAAAGAYSALAALKGASNFPAARDEADEKVAQLLDVMNESLAGQMKTVAGCLTEAASIIFQHFNNTDCPVTRDGVGKVSAWLPSDSLHQPRYLNLYAYASAVNGATSLENLLATVDPDAYCYTSPDDMSARAILTRTCIFLQELEAKGESEWFISTVNGIGELSGVIENPIRSDLMNIRTTLTSKQMNDVAINMSPGSELETAYLKTVSDMMGFVKFTEETCADIRCLCVFYSKLCKIFQDSQETIMAAYHEYVEANRITF